MIENAEYGEGFHDIPPSYRLQVRKEDDRTREKTLASTNIFNVKVDFSRVNFQSQDDSVNIQNRSKTIFEATRQKLHEGVEDKALLKELLGHLQVMEEAKSHSGWAAAYSKLIEGVANHMAIIAPFLPALAETVSH